MNDSVIGARIEDVPVDGAKRVVVVPSGNPAHVITLPLQEDVRRAYGRQVRMYRARRMPPPCDRRNIAR